LRFVVPLLFGHGSALPAQEHFFPVIFIDTSPLFQLKGRLVAAEPEAQRKEAGGKIFA